jgi:ketosteroid isomerase-like protein
LKNRALMTVFAALLALPGVFAAESNADLAAQVRETERAFANTMADRDHAAFASFLADETVFFSGGKVELRGKKAVAGAWKRFYEGPAAPFSWEPEQVAVLESGGLGTSSGPVYDPQGKRVGTFNSIWRREAGGKWKIVFDKGCPPCDCPR